MLKINIEKIIASLIIIICLVFVTLIIFTKWNTTNQPVNPTTAHTKAIETYEYIITKIDPSGYYGKSTNNDTGIYFVNANIPKGTIIQTGDKIRVSFPKGEWDVITNIEKINQ
ncbi:hypothetical protein JK635_01990 [Neobacillus sp. YIM B02564]|uniref:Uncharacterized protein n=1 Tax=Neobacillus paridis TaxID=2803862 RepID=A0ABS1TI58_9BACI|nr:hypothetical protein [Neobacillus paridis]MBL4951010.1 hypothetical protein [Neobacillus paridis]